MSAPPLRRAASDGAAQQHRHKRIRLLPADVQATVATIHGGGSTPLLRPVVMVALGGEISAKRAGVLAKTLSAHGCRVLGPLQLTPETSDREATHLICGSRPGPQIRLAPIACKASLVADAVRDTQAGVMSTPWLLHELDRLARRHRFEQQEEPSPQQQPVAAAKDLGMIETRPLLRGSKPVLYPLEPHQGNKTLIEELSKLLKFERAVGGLANQRLSGASHVSANHPGATRELTLARGIAAVTELGPNCS